MYKIKYSQRVKKQVNFIKQSGLTKKVKQLIEIIKKNPYQSPPSYEKLSGNLIGFYSRRINIQHRLIYEILETEKIVRIISIWSHYE